MLIEKVGHLADRMSINLELPTGDGLRKLAPAKTREKILTPMRQIQRGIAEDKLMVAERKREKKIYLTGGRGSGASVDSVSPDGTVASTPAVSAPDAGTAAPGQKAASNASLQGMEVHAASDKSIRGFTGASSSFISGTEMNDLSSSKGNSSTLPARRGALHYEEKSHFVPAGQSTQMIIGATPETDHQILSVTEALYQKFDLKRVFFSAYTAINEDSALPSLDTKPPLLREHRLYQADWLLRFYGFRAEELLTEERPYFNQMLDPKCDWALRHLEQFPVEINRAEYSQLLRVPGIGVRSARRILRARRSARLDFPDLKKFGVVLKRAAYFITCNGKMMNPVKMEEEYLTRMLTDDECKNNLLLAKPGEDFRQMNLFEDMGLRLS